MVLIGLALVIGGGFVLFEGGYIKTRRQVIDLGALQVTAEQTNKVGPWLAGLAIFAGTGLTAIGLTRKL
ncbi:MAG: hypothetical protein C0503_09465 [Gemmatimonas sp.]|nr:hypothetical protein [Gemmatimonas sp.]